MPPGALAGLTVEQREAAAYLAAMIDGEGSVSVAATGLHAGAKYGRRSVRIGNTDPCIVDAVCEAYEGLDIRYRVNGYQPRGRTVTGESYRYSWEIVVSRRPDLERILLLVPIRSDVKRAKLEQAVGSYCYRVSERRPPRSALEALYVGEELSMREVGLRFDVSVCTVQNWLMQLGIERRDHRAAALIHRARRAA